MREKYFELFVCYNEDICCCCRTKCVGMDFFEKLFFAVSVVLFNCFDRNEFKFV